MHKMYNAFFLLIKLLYHNFKHVFYLILLFTWLLSGKKFVYAAEYDDEINLQVKTILKIMLRFSGKHLIQNLL